MSELVGEQIARARHRRGWTQQRLAEAVKEHDSESRIGRAALAKIESGVRGASIDELMLIAAAINVPPVLLMVPLGNEEAVQITPRSRIHPHLALDWLRGGEALVDTEQRVIDRGDWLAGREPLRLHDELRELQDAYRASQLAVQTSEAVGDESQLVEDRRARAEALQALHAHLRTMQASDVKPPAQTPQRMAEMEALGLAVDGFTVWEPTDDEGVK